MANVFYLDVDDEITSAAARIRTSQDPRVGLVVPPGSRIATSRINFRLLAREALERNRALSIVSTDVAARALAASAGLPVYATVAEFEADQGTQVGGGGDATQAGAAPARAPRGTVDDASGVGLAGSAAPAAAVAGAGARGASGSTGGTPDARVGARSSGASAPSVRVASRSSRASARVAATVITLVVIALVFGLIGVFLLPSATITVTPKLEAVGPLQLSIRADPNTTTPDPVAGVVPAVQLSKDFASFATFNATGQKTTSTTASGTVRFTNNDTGGAAVIPAGSKVSTAAGAVFVTNQDLTVPIATFVPTFKPGVASVGVTAAGAGPAGNVGAGTIRQIPGGFSQILLKVTNPSATSGGKSTTTTQIQKKDTDAAVATLTKGLKQQFAAWLLAPDALAPGSTAFPKTGVLSAAAADTDPSTLIGVAEPTFQLTMTATGTETAVDESTVTTIALGRLRTSVPTQFSLVTGSEKVALGTPRADGVAVVFPVTATASQVRHLDPDTLRQQVKGKSVDEARSILAEDGTVDIQTWPGFVGTIPSLEWRLTLTIATGAASGSPGSSSTPLPTGVREGSPLPSASSSGNP
jgi:hypothetical protein